MRCSGTPTVSLGHFERSAGKAMVQTGRRILVVVVSLGLGTAVRAEFAFEQTEHRLRVCEGGEPVLGFVYRPLEPVEGAVLRSGYVHPLYDLDGHVLTDDFPSYHPHHRGVFFAWPRMTVLARDVDVWHLRGIRPEFESWGERGAGEASAEFEAVHVWRLTDGTPAVREQVRYTIHTSDDVGRNVDVVGRVTNLTAEPIFFRGQRGRGYGGSTFAWTAAGRAFASPRRRGRWRGRRLT